MSAASDNFEAGVAALGVIDGGRADQRQALQYFTAATDFDAAMCDAWLGRILCGDNGSATIYKAWRCRDQMHAQVNRMGINPSRVWAKFDIGMGIIGLEQPIYDQSSLGAALARTLAMAEPPDYSEAIDTLAEGTATAVTEWVRAAIYYRAERWPDVIDTVTSSWRLFDKDAALKVAAELVLGIAHAYLGEFDDAGSFLRKVCEQDVLAAATSAAQWFSALIARERGDEDTAVGLLRQVAAEAPSEQVRAAINDSGIRLQVTNRDAIGERTDAWDPATGPSAQDLLGARQAAARAELLAEATDELDSQIGMYELKDQIKTFRARMRMAEKRRELGLKTPAASNHMVFVGPPGTGKTSVARVIAKTLCGLGIVSTSKIVDISAKELIGEHLGESEAKTRATVTRALDGVLFIDEAYSLVSAENKGSNADAFGKAVVDTLLTYIENERERLVVIIAGYETDIDQLLAVNEGMQTRFAHRFRFNTYSPDELIAIADVLAAQRDDSLDLDSVEVLRNACQSLSALTVAGGRSAIDVVGNGRFIRKVLENAADYRDLRNDEDDPEVLDEKSLMTVRRPDISRALHKVVSGESAKAGRDLTTALAEEV
jgi:type VII secretion ATPase EccA